MLSFKEWLKEEAKNPKKKKESKYVKSTDQGSPEGGELEPTPIRSPTLFKEGGLFFAACR